MTDKHISKLTAWAARTPEVRRIFTYINSRREKDWPARAVNLAIEVAPLRHGPLSPFSLWFFEQSQFWEAIFNATPADFRFALDGYYPECPEVIDAVVRTGKLVYDVAQTAGK